MWLLQHFKEVPKEVENMLLIWLNLILVFLDLIGLVDLNSYFFIFLLLMSFMLFTFIHLKLDSSIIFFLSFLLIVLIPISLLFNQTLLAEKLGLWSFLLMVSGIILGVIEERFAGERISVWEIIRDNYRRFVNEK